MYLRTPSKLSLTVHAHLSCNTSYDVQSSSTALDRVYRLVSVAICSTRASGHRSFRYPKGVVLRGSICWYPPPPWLLSAQGLCINYLAPSYQMIVFFSIKYCFWHYFTGMLTFEPWMKMYMSFVSWAGRSAVDSCCLKVTITHVMRKRKMVCRQGTHPREHKKRMLTK